MSKYVKDDPKTIQEMFGSIAAQYDRANAVMSFNMHKLWNRQLVKQALKQGSSKQYLDLCCGTGEIAFKLLNSIKQPCEAFLLDFCKEMLECAEVKAPQNVSKEHQIRYIQADAQEIPLPECSIDCVTIAYGIRNVQNPLKCFKDVYRVTRVGGQFCILELTQPTNPIMKLGHKCYLKAFLPTIGKWVASNRDAYSYLCKSIQTFTPPKDLEALLLEAGFSKVTIHSLMGGVATILVADK